MQGFHPIHVSYINTEEISSTQFRKIESKIHTLTALHDTGINDKVLKTHILGRWLMHSMLTMYGIDEELQKKIEASSFGKPMLYSGNVYFNVAHSNNMVICVATSVGEVGVDIEHIRPVEWKQYDSCFSLDEWRTIALSEDPNWSLLEAWTKKESLVKADGRGLQVPLIDVHLGQYENWVEGENKKWFITPVPVPGYVAHICSSFSALKIEFVKQLLPGD
jgi:phosphopantetheinyl transferase